MPALLLKEKRNNRRNKIGAVCCNVCFYITAGPVSWKCGNRAGFYYDYPVCTGETVEHEVGMEIPLMPEGNENGYLASRIRKEVCMYGRLAFKYRIEDAALIYPGEKITIP